MNQESVHKLLIGLLIATLFVVGFNAVRLSKLDNVGSFVPAVAAAVDGPTAQVSAAPSNSEIIPTGVPAIYGKELGVSFDDVTVDDPQKADATIRKLGKLDQTITLSTLSATDKERYINVAYKLENGISCEYCCGARAIIFENGEPACGCAHSYAMRGLAKYLITK